jgi:hypothetical protein
MIIDNHHYLCLCRPDRMSGLDPFAEPPRALVRTTRLTLCGHFPMGVIRVGHYNVTVSGDYGNMGLPVDVPLAVWRQGLQLPQYLVEMLLSSEGWNVAGAEAQAMRSWARKNLTQLQSFRKLPEDPIHFPDLEDTSKDFLFWKDVNQHGISYVAMTLKVDFRAYHQGQIRLIREVTTVGIRHTPVSQEVGDAWAHYLIARVEAHLVEQGWTVARGATPRDTAYIPPEEISWTYLAGRDPATYVPLLTQAGYACDSFAIWRKPV